MFRLSRKLATSLFASTVIFGGGVTPVLAQYSGPSREIQSVQEVGDYKFELKGCQRSGKQVTCSAWVTQTNRDNNYLSYLLSGSGWGNAGSTRLIDAAGTEHLAAAIQVGRKISEYSALNASLVKDVPLLLSATFVDVPASVQDIALFELSLYSMLNGDLTSNLKGQLRNIKITESKGSNPPTPKKKK